jgi:hypothetical protein
MGIQTGLAGSQAYTLHATECFFGVATLGKKALDMLQSR